MSIRTRIISMVVVPVIIVTVVLSLLSTSMAHDSSMGDMEESLSNLDASYAQTLETKLDNFRTQVEWLAREERFYSNELSDTDKVKILQQLAEGSDVSNVGIFGADGKNIYIGYTNGETLPPGIADVSGRPYFSPALGGETVVFGPSKDVVTGDLLVTVVTKVRAKTAPASILAVDFSLDDINAQVEHIKFNQTGRAILLDKEGMILSCPNKALIGENYKDISKLDSSMAGFADAVPGILSGKNGKGYFDAGKVENAYAYREISSSDGWILVTMVESGEYYADSERAFFIQWAVAAVLIVITVLFALFTGNNIAKPIQAVSKSAADLSEGRLVHPDVLPRATKRKDEVGTLVRSMDSAVTTLDSYIHDISDKLGSLAANNFDVEVNTEYLGEFEAIKTSMNQIVTSLNSTMIQITQAANQVDSGSSQVSDAAQALSQGATEQASSTEEISATMISSAEEMKRTAIDTTEAMSKTNTNNEMLSKAKISMDSMLSSMEEIDRASEAIGKIIKTIDDIAFQTNILALNAAVEAARAGQHGRGFAVVADEVRNLAAKSAEAASETNQLILSARNAVNQGVTIAQQTAEEIEETTRQSAEIANIISSVEEAVTNQADNFNQLNMAVEQISIVTQTNSATAEESAAASEELSSMSHMLKALVSGIRLKNQPAPAAAFAPGAGYPAAIPEASANSYSHTATDDVPPPPPADNYFSGGAGEEVW